MLLQEFLQRVRHRVRRVWLKRDGLDVIHLRHLLRGHFARDGCHAGAEYRCLERPSGLRGDGLPGRNRLPGDAIQFAFTLLNYYQYVVCHKSSQFSVLRKISS